MTGLKPENVFHYFEEISKIPRGSGNTKAVSDYCVAFAQEHGLEVSQDEWNNVIIRKPASKGREKEAGIILQGHLDMVNEKTPESTHDFMRDGIELMIKGEFLTAKDTTLGADDGIAVAYSLALLADETLSHPQLEVLLTTDEETGMDGARNMDLSDITGKYVLNMDSEDEGIITAGCAGGGKAKTAIPVEREDCTGSVYALRISGCKGGHSGVEIHKGRANADILMGRFLKGLSGQTEVHLIHMNGGGKDNAIPRVCEAKIVLAQGDEEILLNQKKMFEEVVQKEYASTDPDIVLECVKEAETGAFALTKQSTEQVLNYLMTVPDQVMYMSHDIDGLVETSLNLGILSLEEKELQLCTSVRSSVRSRKDLLFDKLRAMAEIFHGTIEISGEYPEWEYRKDSLLRDTAQEIYHELYGEELKVDVIHAGLECGYLLQKKPDLDIISFGPQMYDIHTTEERLSIPSAEKVYRFVRTMIEHGIK